LVEYISIERLKMISESDSLNFNFEGKVDECSVYYKDNMRILMVGIGKEENVNREIIKNATSQVIDELLKLKIVNVIVKPPCYLKLLYDDILSSIILSSLSTHYKFERKDKSEQSFLNQIQLIKNSDISSELFNEIVNQSIIISNAVNYTRDLVNERSDVCNPQFLESKAIALVEEFPNLFEIEILNHEALKEKGLLLLYNVGKGAPQPPRLIIIKYKR